MPRDAAGTRQRLLVAGRRLFADNGVYATSLKAVVEQAGQRNTSALHYHFGGRDGLLTAILDVHNARIETARQSMLDAPTLTLDDLVAAVVLPQAALLHEQDGREFLSIISQLSDLFDRWEDGRTPEQAMRAFLGIKQRLPADLPDDLRHERVTRFLELVAQALGSRARQIDAGLTPTVEHDTWVDNLATMAVGALSATGRGRGRPTPPARAGSR
ncbi:MAG: TetR/AcrR family transcriptional regulator [Acidimicrobiales bacterium]|nr:MAG: TetR/AcrR family transcriptional regulator [Acidimicrobiales bacterium]